MPYPRHSWRIAEGEKQETTPEQNLCMAVVESALLDLTSTDDLTEIDSAVRFFTRSHSPIVWMLAGLKMDEDVIRRAALAHFDEYHGLDWNDRNRVREALALSIQRRRDTEKILRDHRAESTRKIRRLIAENKRLRARLKVLLDTMKEETHEHGDAA